MNIYIVPEQWRSYRRRSIALKMRKQTMKFAPGKVTIFERRIIQRGYSWLFEMGGLGMNHREHDRDWFLLNIKINHLLASEESVKKLMFEEELRS